jgi:hypothetical protein
MSGDRLNRLEDRVGNLEDLVGLLADLILKVQYRNVPLAELLRHKGVITPEELQTAQQVIATDMRDDMAPSALAVDFDPKYHALRDLRRRVLEKRDREAGNEEEM